MMASYVEIDLIDTKYKLYKVAKLKRASEAYRFVVREFPDVVADDKPKHWPTLITIESLLFLAIVGLGLLARLSVTMAIVLASIVLLFSSRSWFGAMRRTLRRHIPKEGTPSRERAFALAYAWVDTQDRFWRYGAIVRAWENREGKRFSSWPSDRRDH